MVFDEYYIHLKLALYRLNNCVQEVVSVADPGFILEDVIPKENRLTFGKILQVMLRRV